MKLEKEVESTNELSLSESSDENQLSGVNDKKK